MRSRSLWLITGLMGCSDYNFKGADPLSEAGQPVDSGAPPVIEEPLGSPRAVVSPGAVDLGIVCGSGASEVQVENQGDDAFDVTSIDTNSPSWTASHEALPVTLQPGETLAIGVSGTPSDAIMVIGTTDPAHLELEVPLTATADAPPALSIIHPATGSTLGVGAVTSFEALVTEDTGPADSVSLSWKSDTDGLLDSSSADGTGAAGFDWDGNVRSSGTHVVTLTATDTCGNSVEADVVVCQNEGYLAENLDLATWNFEGSAVWDSANNWVELTSAVQSQGGTAFQTAAAVDSANVQIEFSFYGSGGNGADGLSVTALDVDRMTSFVGLYGGGLGFGELPGWSIEVDTYYNGFDPTSTDHLAIHVDGDYANPVAWTSLPEMEDGNWHLMSINVTGTWVTVLVDGVTYIDQDIPELTSFPAYVGFTAATGYYTNNHLIDSLQVEEFVCD